MTEEETAPAGVEEEATGEEGPIGGAGGEEDEDGREDVLEGRGGKSSTLSMKSWFHRDFGLNTAAAEQTCGNRRKAGPCTGDRGGDGVGGQPEGGGEGVGEGGGGGEGDSPILEVEVGEGGRALAWALAWALLALLPGTAKRE